MTLEKIQNNKIPMILQFAIPSIIAMVLTSLVNITDGYFVGNYVGTEGLAAVNLGLPIVYLYLAVGLMIAVGGISIAGRKLGGQLVEEANQVFRETMVICVAISALLTMILFILLKPISGLFQVSELTQIYFRGYYSILLFELPLMIIISAFGMFIRGEGNPVFVMLTNLITVVLNIILDYIFIALLRKGVEGSAWASLLSALTVLVINVLYFFKRSTVFRFGSITFEGKVIRNIFLNGGSEFIGEMSMCISMVAYNFVVIKYAGVEGVAAFTIIGYVSYVFSMIVVGFGQGIVPIVSFSYGAKEFLLSREVRNISMKMLTAAAIAVFIVMSFVTGWYARLFTDSEAVMNMVLPGLRIQMSSFVFAGFNTIASFYFTAIGRVKESAVISAARGLVVLMIAIAVLPAMLGITGVWFVSLTTETVTLLFSIVYMRQNACADGIRGETYAE